MSSAQSSPKTHSVFGTGSVVPTVTPIQVAALSADVAAPSAPLLTFTTAAIQPTAAQAVVASTSVLASSSSQAITFDPNTMVDVAAYGALGNGADATAAIEQAEHAALASGKALFFGAGTYDISSTLYLSSGETWIANPGDVTLQAASGLSTMLALSGAPSAGTGAAPAPIENVSLSGLTFEGAAAAPANPSALLVSWIASNLRFTDDSFVHIAGVGLLLSNAANTTISGCSFSDIGNGTATATDPCDTASQGIAFTDSSILDSQDNVVAGCTFSAIGLDAISATQQTDFVASGNVMTDLNVLPGYSLCPAGAAGIYLNQDTNVRVAGNSIEGASGNGIDALEIQNLQIIQNTIENSYEAGIAVCKTSNALLYGNTANNNNVLLDHFPQTAGITIVANPDNAAYQTTLIDNNSTNTGSSTSQDWGLQIDSGAPATQITIGSGNSFTGNSRGATSAVVAQQSATLTTGTDTIALTGSNAMIVAVANALSLHDNVTDDKAATLLLQGSGIFDLRAPQTLSNVQTLIGQEGDWSSATTAGQMQLVYLRDGLTLDVDVLPATSSSTANAGIVIFGANDSSVINLSAGTDYVYLGSSTETALGGGGADTFVIDAATAGATIDGGTGASTLMVRGGGTVTMGANITRIAGVTLNAAAGATAPAPYNFTANATPDLAITGSGGADTITVGAGSQSVDANGGAVHVTATAAEAGIKVTGATGAVLELTSGGAATLNAATSNVVVQLDLATNLALNGMSFVSAVGEVAGNTITAGAAGQTLGGLAGGDTLIGYSGFGDTFAGAAAGLQGDILKGFGGSDVIDLADIAYGSNGPALSYAGTATQGTLSIADGVHGSSLTLIGGFSQSHFQTAADGHGGTLVTYF